MTSTPLSSQDQAAAVLPTPTSGVRAAVRDVPAYPFTPIDAPIKLDQNESAYDFPADLKAQAVERMLAPSLEPLSRPARRNPASRDCRLRGLGRDRVWWSHRAATC